MITLYYMPGACSMAVHVALLETGKTFTLENVAVPDGQPRSPEFLKVNPRGNVPVLDMDGLVIREGAAILTYLLETAKSPLLPASGPQRAKALEWLCFANSSLHPAYGRLFGLNKMLGDKAASDPIYTAGVAAAQKLWDDIEQQLSSQPYVCGSECTIADILITVIANWTPAMKQPIRIGDKTKAMFAKVIARPAYQEALKSEKVEYKMAA